MNIIQVLHTILPFLFLITVLVFVHELGHYIAARLNGVHVEDFAIGYGSKKIISYYDKNKTCWSIRPFPFGGFAKMKGDADGSSAIQIKDEKLANDNSSILSKKPYQKFIIAIAGPAFNFMFSFLLIAGLYSVSGKKKVQPVISKVYKNSIAEVNGFQAGDLIVKINEKTINNFDEVQKNLILSGEKNFTFNIMRGGNLLIKEVSFRDVHSKILGIKSTEPTFTKLNILKSAQEAGIFVLENIKTTFITFKLLIAGDISKDNLGGPISIAKYSRQASESGLYNFFIFMAFVSINLGAINLVPIPIVDGGQALIHLVEMIFKKDLTYTSFKKYFMYVGYLLVACLMILSTFNDIKRIIF